MLDHSLWLDLEAGPRFGERVSILVVLDHSLWLQNRDRFAVQRGGFNPCCVGSFAVARSQAASAIADFCFNPCCVGSFAVATRRRGGYRCGAVSILVVLDHSLWPSLPKSPRKTASRFNPCCVGSFAVARSSASSAKRESGFNPCCVGSFAVACRPRERSKKSFGFNPCCVGSFAVALRQSPLCGGRRKFQSLLCWIIRCGVNPRQPRKPIAEFQSLLCWIIRCGNLDSIKASLKELFQSLLCWIIRCG